VTFVTRQDTVAGRIGRVLIGLGLITLALHLIVEATRPLTDSPAVRALLVALPNDVLLDIVVGVVLTVLSYSSLAIVLLTATLRRRASCLQAWHSAWYWAPTSAAACSRCSPPGRFAAGTAAAGGNFMFKAAGALIAIPLLPQAHLLLQQHVPTVHQQVVVFHLGFNIAIAIVFLGLTGTVARIADRLLPAPVMGAGTERPRHLEPLSSRHALARHQLRCHEKRCIRRTWSRPCFEASCP